ncbi:MAG: nickel pincer cofactor biosynthesis protein LarB, partial [Spirochaetaceae bacterium]|nr:nickel pincer cofactor biosynthesis protein LarB [Spirochaetaceae bacterium]
MQAPDRGLDLGFAVVDESRAERTGYPEAVFCAGKTVEQSEEIIARMREKHIPVLATRAQAELAARIAARFPEARYDGLSRVLTIGVVAGEAAGKVAVVCAGTSDLPAAREALLCAEFFGSRAVLMSDVGVAGIHRLFARLDEIRSANVVIAGLVSAPVIALPTSVGYGASFGGLSALLGMLTSCAPGISVVNIDNGFGA